ncbi:HK97-gp10 family putative phage morphogenesis protein [Pseudorhodoferax soli]|uniref:HK97 gp10 family phage protein n=1 Tax=Pseudorhodoferax soli TaxID=545864 RepID=A0A368Y0J4_9BURK|nr:HK97-gp10 family putative phage morphogenesis protein [Pseudorhodoferax soli]RCW73811.1 HK97 gp10 family phage protein [Pseudorhodoferax soli]
MADTFDLQGFDSAIAKLRALPVQFRGKAGRSALGKAARLVTNAAKRNAEGINDPETGRKISDNVVQRVRSGYQKRTGDIMISVGVATERGAIPKGNPDTGPKGNTPHWHLVELGTEQMAAQPFLRPALEGNVDQVVAGAATNLERELDKIAKKAGA